MKNILKNNKKGTVQLSIEFIVMFILAITVFSLGLFITAKIYHDADEYRKQLQQQEEDAIETAFVNGEIVSVGIKTKDIEKGDENHFKLGIKNTADAEDTFYIDIKCDNAYTKNNQRICDEDKGIPCTVCSNWFVSVDSIKIDSNQRKTLDVFVVVPRKSIDPNNEIVKGTYTFNLIVKNSKGQYDNIEKIVINT